MAHGTPTGIEPLPGSGGAIGNHAATGTLGGSGSPTQNGAAIATGVHTETEATLGPAVIAGSVCGWGASLETAFDLVVFLSLATPLRMQRIQARELALFGRADPAFLAWAAQYDDGAMPGRSRARHEAWLAQLTCQVMRFDGDQPVRDRVQAILHAAARHAC